MAAICPQIPLEPRCCVGLLGVVVPHVTDQDSHQDPCECED